MLDANQSARTSHQSSIAQWVYLTIGLQEMRLRTRLRGNDLHILCESTECPDVETVVSRFVRALEGGNGAEAFPTDPGNPIYQAILYGRAFDRQRPDWIKAIRLERPQRSQSPSPQDAKTTPQNPVTAAGRGHLVSSESLARSGQPDAIARYLSETLSPMGVSIKVFIQEATASDGNKTKAERAGNADTSTLPAATTQLNRRLWVVCNCDYSPDASLIAGAVTERLRSLKLLGFYDARIVAQVSGEAKPDWVLRVDMTPPEEMLSDWARWGDVQAIARLLNEKLAALKLQVRVVLKEATLHLFTSPAKGSRTPSTSVFDKQAVWSAIASVLESIEPQGIHAATVYGMREPRSAQRDELNFSFAQHSLKEETPLWIEWLNLPAKSNPAKAATTLALAQQGDEPALLFLLQRLLNPNLDWRLATGGIRVLLRRTPNLLHIMTEAPVCPSQGQVASPVAKFIRQLLIPNIAGVRVYGRRAGTSAHEWSYGVDFVAQSRSHSASSSPVEFAASGAAMGCEQIVSVASIAERPESTTEVGSLLGEAFGLLGKSVRRGLCFTQLFIPAVQDKESQEFFVNSSLKSANDTGQKPANKVRMTKDLRVALVWGTLGLLLTLQADWLMGQMLRLYAQSDRSSVVAELEQGIIAPAEDVPIPDMPLQKRQTLKSNAGRDKAPAFNSGGFTKDGETSVVVTPLEDGNELGEGTRVFAGGAAILASARSPYPSFNNRLLDEKLALYQQRLVMRRGVPPDVLIVGSSRAMRGIDPAALRTALSANGSKGNVEIFNFGVNGATARVVDLILRRILNSSKLPKLIIWADGARAFNSGRIDATYNAIAASAGYQQLNAGTLPKEATGSRISNPQSPNLTSIYQNVEATLNQTLAKLSSTYPQRDRLQKFVLDRFSLLMPMSALSEVKSADRIPVTGEEPNFPRVDSYVDSDGFLPLSIRFVPIAYYKHHPKVSGSYDGDYESFQMGGQQDKALETLLQFLEDNQVQLVFVNLPLTSNYLDPVRTKYEQEFQRHMQSVSSQKKLIFRDLSRLWPAKHEYFSDPSHLNRYGAYEVSNLLTADPMIPWPTSPRSE